MMDDIQNEHLISPKIDNAFEIHGADQLVVDPCLPRRVLLTIFLEYGLNCFFVDGNIKLGFNPSLCAKNIKAMISDGYVFVWHYIVAKRISYHLKLVEFFMLMVYLKSPYFHWFMRIIHKCSAITHHLEIVTH